MTSWKKASDELPPISTEVERYWRKESDPVLFTDGKGYFGVCKLVRRYVGTKEENDPWFSYWQTVSFVKEIRGNEGFWMPLTSLPEVPIEWVEQVYNPYCNNGPEQVQWCAGFLGSPAVCNDRYGLTFYEEGKRRRMELDNSNAKQV